MTTKTPEGPGMVENAFPFKTDNPSGVPGTTEIAENVVAAIVGNAAEQVAGVASIGAGNILRTVASVIESTADTKAAGVEAEVGQREAIFDIELVVQYGQSIPEVVKNVREVAALELRDQVGLVAKEVNVSVVEIKFDDKESGTTRVQ